MIDPGLLLRDAFVIQLVVLGGRALPPVTSCFNQGSTSFENGKHAC